MRRWGIGCLWALLLLFLSQFVPSFVVGFHYSYQSALQARREGREPSFAETAAVSRKAAADFEARWGESLLAVTLVGTTLATWRGWLPGTKRGEE